MCGIIAIIVKDPTRFDAWSKKAPKLVKLMTHRGPDAEGLETHNNIILGHRRLAIIDLSDAGIQPMASDDRRFFIILNGEIYNYLEIREELVEKGITFRSESDTEVLLKGYIHFGKEIFNKINGMFSFIILDTEKEEVLVARDRFGIKPLYYSNINGDIIISSEIRPIVEMLDDLQPDYSTIYDLAVFTSIDHSDRTFFQGIHRFPAGHYLALTQKNNYESLNFEKYWDLLVEIKKIRKNPNFKKRNFEEHQRRAFRLPLFLVHLFPDRLEVFLGEVLVLLLWLLLPCQ